MKKDLNNKLILGDELYNKVASSHILMVGAGGIGCELLKNLVLSGFKSIVVIDLDTIDISNLNRQFLFQKQHVKKAKALVAKESALRFNPDIKIESHQADIKNKEFNVDWFKKFTIVFNALDNLDARKHVNAMCLAANIPLIESGTTGYLGQSYVIKKDITECFDCQPKPTPTTYPVCTIRSTPSAPIHCIVWAKSYLFNQLFGNSEDEEAFEQEKSDENAQELEALSRETEALKIIKDAMGTIQYPQQVFDKVFKSDIDRLLTMEDMWKNRKEPTPLDYEQLSKGREIELSNTATPSDENSNNDKLFNGLQDQKVWTIGESFDMFRSSVTKLSERLQHLQKDKPDSILVFDKDDDDALQFVTAASNLRARIFGIQEKSLFEVKSMAGNIIPAIATTNAIISGVVVMKAFEVLRGSISTIQRTYLTTVPRLLVQEKPSGPNPDCQVCQATSAILKVNLEKATLRNLIEDILLLSVEKGGAGLTEEIAIMDGERMLYDIEYDDNIDTSFKDLKILDGSVLRIGSEDGDEDLDIIINTSSSEVHLVELLEPIIKVKKEKQLKRPLETDRLVEQQQKKQKSDSSIVEIEDDEDGVIVLLDD